MIIATEIWVTLVAAIGAVGAIAALKLKLDLNRWVEQRQESKLRKLRAICPHTEITMSNGELAVVSHFSSPAGTRSWTCAKCGFTTHDERIPVQMRDLWGSDPMAWAKRMKQFAKLFRKTYGV